MATCGAGSDKPTSLTLIGVGLIGSYLAEHLARMRGIGRVTLIDPDSYSTDNAATQSIVPDDAGKPKVEVQARKLREIKPELHVVPIQAAVERLPWGWLRADAMLTALDSRRARQHVNAIARRLGCLWIDSGVHADERLVRVSTYLPFEDAPCMECAWSEGEYELIDQDYPCGASAAEAPSTGGTSSLGAIAAALQANELDDLLRGRLESWRLGREVILSTAHHRVLINEHRRNPDCRLRDHTVWTIERLGEGPDALTLGDLLGLDAPGSTAHQPIALRVEGSRFVTRLQCGRCQTSRKALRLEASLTAADTRCPACGEAMSTIGMEKIERLDLSSLSRARLDASLASVGIRSGDVISIGQPAEEQHLEMGGDDE